MAGRGDLEGVGAVGGAGDATLLVQRDDALRLAVAVMLSMYVVGNKN